MNKRLQIIRLKAQIEDARGRYRNQKRVVEIRPDGENVLSCRHSNYYMAEIGDMVSCVGCHYLDVYDAVKELSRLEDA